MTPDIEAAIEARAAEIAASFPDPTVLARLSVVLGVEGENKLYWSPPTLSDAA